MIGDLERIKRVGVKSRTAGAKKKPTKIVPPHRIGATHVQRDVSSYDGMVESLPIVEPPCVEATRQPTRGREDDRLQQLEMKVSSMAEDISKLVTLLAPGGGAADGGREYKEAVPTGSSDERPKTPPRKRLPDPGIQAGVQVSEEPGTCRVSMSNPESNPESRPESKPEGELASVVSFSLRAR